MPQQPHRAVNWVDGMKISKTHFIETDHYHTWQVMQAMVVQALTTGYGLFAADGNSLSLQVLADTSGTLSVRVDHCRAIAPDGSLIRIGPEMPLLLETSIDSLLATYPDAAGKVRDYYVILSADPFERVPFGQPELDDEPVRHPYTEPAYHLKIAPVDRFNPAAWSGSGIVIAKLNHSAAGFSRAQEYIPACVTVSSYRPLLTWLRGFEDKIREMETSCVRIIHKIRTKSQKSALSDTVFTLADRVVTGCAQCLPVLRIQAPGSSLPALAALLLQPLYDIRSALIILPDREREELLAYLGEWSDETPGNIEKHLQTIGQLTVNMLETAEYLEETRRFMDFWIALFSKLSQLEFIGKRKGQQVFIVESPVHDPPPVPEKPKSRWSPI